MNVSEAEGRYQTLHCWCQTTYTDLWGRQAWSPQGHHTRQPSEELNVELTFLFPLGPEAWLDRVPQVSEIPVSDAIPQGETFWELVGTQSCPWTRGSQPRSSQTLLTRSAYPKTCTGLGPCHRGDCGLFLTWTLAASIRNWGKVGVLICRFEVLTL